MKRFILPAIIIVSFSNLLAQISIDSTEIKNDSLPQAIAISELTKSPLVTENGLKGFDIISINGNFSYFSYYDWIHYKHTVTSIAVNLGWSQFMYQNTAIGVNVSYNRLSNTAFYENTKSTSSDSYTMFGPKAGYYFGTRASKYIPFIAVEYDFYVGKLTNYQEKRAGVGCIFQVKPKIGISFGADYIINKADNMNIQASLGLVGLLY